jgi:serine/threonine protein kinase
MNKYEKEFSQRKSLISLKAQGNNWIHEAQENAEINKAHIRADKVIGSAIEDFNKKYIKGDVIGEGNFGSVYTCFLKHGDPNQQFALKVLRKQDFAEGYSNILLKSELFILEKTFHPNIVRIVDVFYDGNYFYIV